MTTLLITGVTGFLGGAALEKILHQDIDLLLLVRASPEAGLERVKENMRKFNIAEEKLAMLTAAYPAGRSRLSGAFS
jgi:thioester reductase-like protein